MPETSVFTLFAGRAATPRVTKVRACSVSAWSRDPTVYAAATKGSASGKEECRGLRVWHLSTSALPPKISKMSIVPSRFFSPSVINYYVVEKIHRLAENTERRNIWKQLEKKYNHVKPIIQLKKVYFSNGKHEVRKFKSPWHFNSGEWLLVLILSS